MVTDVQTNERKQSATSSDLGNCLRFAGNLPDQHLGVAVFVRTWVPDNRRDLLGLLSFRIRPKNHRAIASMSVVFGQRLGIWRIIIWSSGDRLTEHVQPVKVIAGYWLELHVWQRQQNVSHLYTSPITRLPAVLDSQKVFLKRFECPGKQTQNITSNLKFWLPDKKSKFHLANAWYF